MRLSQAFWQTIREVPADAVVPSHQLMLRAGLIQRGGLGLYSFLPLGVRALRKVEKIIREEHDRKGCQEVIMSVVTAGELWQETGRWETMGPLMLHIKDRGNRDLTISPTNEEAITDCFRKQVTSYRQLPINLYQINTKFRDEIRPRYGLMRAREFTMKDAYSFHMDKACLDRWYQTMYEVYSSIFSRMGLDFIAVEADAGAMAEGGAKTHEFQVIADAGEDNIIHCPKCNYSANNEKAEGKRTHLNFSQDVQLTEVPTPGKSSIADVATFLSIPEHHTLKSMLYTLIIGEKEKHVLLMLLGDDEINEVKLKNAFKAEHVVTAREDVLEHLQLIKGFIGPNDNSKLEVFFDSAIDLNKGFVVGGGKTDLHLKGYVPSSQIKAPKVLDLRMAKQGDSCPKCSAGMIEKKGIEVGHIFQLGDKYTKSMKVTVLDEKGKGIAPLMGCYGIGVTRVVAAAIEQHHDQDGIIWPKEIAPYHVYFAFMSKSPEHKALAEKIYNDLLKAGIEVIWDDRGLAFGVMMKDADLLGLPLRLVFGERDFTQSGQLEIMVRRTKEKHKVSVDQVVSSVRDLLEKTH